MAKLPLLPPREIIRALEKVGFVEIPGRGKGSPFSIEQTHREASRFPTSGKFVEVHCGQSFDRPT